MHQCKLLCLDIKCVAFFIHCFTCYEGNPLAQRKSIAADINSVSFKAHPAKHIVVVQLHCMHMPIQGYSKLHELFSLLEFAS